MIVEAASRPPTTLLPGLPDAYADSDPTRVPSNQITFPIANATSVFYVDYDNLDGYDAARAYGFSLQNIADSMPNVAHTAHLEWSSVPP